VAQIRVVHINLFFFIVLSEKVNSRFIGGGLCASNMKIFQPRELQEETPPRFQPPTFPLPLPQPCSSIEVDPAFTSDKPAILIKVFHSKSIVPKSFLPPSEQLALLTKHGGSCSRSRRRLCRFFLGGYFLHRFPSTSSSVVETVRRARSLPLHLWQSDYLDCRSSSSGSGRSGRCDAVQEVSARRMHNGFCRSKSELLLRC
jgi:hypothetical protein